MKNRFWKCLSIMMILASAVTSVLSDPGPSVFHIPKVEGLAVDGEESDWRHQGFRVGILAAPDGKVLPVEDFDVTFRLAWDSQGLYVLVIARDDMGVEQESLSRLWRSDCLEISVAEDVGHTNAYMLAIAPGIDRRYEKPRSRIFDWRQEAQRPASTTSDAASRKLDGGYVLEAFLPWKNLGIQPRTGSRIGFQLVANDDDGQGPSHRVAWFPEISPADSATMHALLLSDDASEPVLFRVDREIDELHYEVSVQGAGETSGTEVMVRSGDRIVDRTRLAGDSGRANAVFSWERAENRAVWPPIRVEASGKILADYDEIPFLDRIVASYIRAVGGEESVKGLKTRSCKGRYSLNRDNVLRLDAFAVLPDKWTFGIQSPRMTEKNGYDGTVGWVQNADRIERADHLSRSILGWWLNPHGPVLFSKYFPHLRLKGKNEREGKTVYTVESAVPNSTKRTLEFDAGTGLLWRVDQNVVFEDYRKIDGILFPCRLVIDRGERTSVFELDEVNHNVAVDDRVFLMPDAADVFPDAFRGIDDAKVLPMLKMEDLSYRHGEMNIPCRDGRFLYDLIIEKGYKRGLEIGTYNGYSTLWSGLAFRETGGKIYTIEIDPQPARVARQNFLKAGLTDVIDARINDAFDEITGLDGEFDFVFIDANKEDYGRFFDVLKDRLKPGGALVGHNVTNSAREMKDFLDAIRNEPGFETTFHPVSAEGISVSFKIPALEHILDRYIEALGGRGAIERLTTRVCKGRFVDDRPYAGPVKTIPFDALSKVPDKSLFILHHPENTEWEGFDGNVRWRMDNNGLIRRENQERSQMDYFLDPQNALNIQDYFPGMEVMGTVKLRGLSVYVVENKRKSPHYTLYFDSANGLLVQIGFYEIYDYQDVDGVRFPFRLEYSRKGGSNSYIFDEVQHNVPVEDDRFSKPPKKDGVKFSERS